MGQVAPNLSYHFWGMNIRDFDSDVEPTTVGVFIRGSEFNHNKEIEMQDDEGHMGTATTKISTYRSKASASPSFTDRCRYKEGWEDIWLLLLGSGDHTDDYAIDKTTVTTGVYKYVFSVDVSQPNSPYFCMLYNGFGKGDDDNYKYEDCLLSEFELGGSNEDAPTYTSTFASNYPKFNQADISRTYPSVTQFPKSADVKIYIAPKGTTDANMTNFEYPCYQEWSLSVNNNIESVPCSGDDFGESTKVLGNREGTFSITLPWTEATKNLEYKFMGGSNDATTVTTENDVKTVWIVMTGSTISSTYKYQTTIKIPSIVMTAVDSPQSGSEAKTLQLEGNIEEDGTNSFITTEIQTDLSDLHIASS